MEDRKLTFDELYNEFKKIASEFDALNFGDNDSSKTSSEYIAEDYDQDNPLLSLFGENYSVAADDEEEDNDAGYEDEDYEEEDTEKEASEIFGDLAMSIISLYEEDSIKIASEFERYSPSEIKYYANVLLEEAGFKSRI